MKNNIKKPLNSLIEIDKKILPFFSNPVILKRISDQKKNIDSNKLNPQKKLIYKIIKLNEKLVKFSTSIKQYNLNLDSFFLPAFKGNEGKKSIGNGAALHLPVLNNEEVGNNSEFILFVRNNLYYNLKFRWSNILYKIEKLIPVLKFYSLLNNINLFAPKRLLKPQSYIRYYYRIITINKSVDTFAAKQQAPITTASQPEQINLIPSISAPNFMVGEGKGLPKALSASHYGPGKKKVSAKLKSKELSTITPLGGGRSKVLIKINEYNDKSYTLQSPIQLHKFENGRSIKYILKNLNTLLTEIDNIIFIKNLLIKVIKIKNIKNMQLAAISPLKAGEVSEQNNNFKGLEHVDSKTSATKIIPNVRKDQILSSQSPLLKTGMVKENIIKIERASIITSIKEGEKDIINENSNPVDLLYFNNNLKRPIINQYIKSMSTYNMITNGTILYYSNIIGFNFKKRIRAYLPFINTVSLKAGSVGAVGGERLTSPYSIRGLRKVIGSLDQYNRQKFSIFGRGIENNKLINNIYKFLYLSFRSMYCLISKPVFIVKSNKIIIQLFYFLLIPKIFKHVKSKANHEANNARHQIRVNRKKLYKKIVDKKKTQAFASLYEGRFKVKKDAHIENYFASASQPSSLNGNEPVGKGINSLATRLPFNQKGNEAQDVWWLHPTKGVYDFVQNQNKVTTQLNNSNTSIMSLDAKSAQLLAQTYYNELKEIHKNEEKISGVEFDKFGMARLKSVEFKRFIFRLKNEARKGGDAVSKGRGEARSERIKKRIYNLFLKRFNNMINDLHVLRVPKNWSSYSSTQKTRRRRFEGSKAHQNLFRYLALTYLNIFKLKSSHPLLNRLKFKLKWFKKDLIKDYSLSNTEFKGGLAVRNRVQSRNNFKINLYLFKKLFWSVRLSKLIIPNAKILQKLGIPKWRWPYSGLKKKGYPQLITSTQPILSYSWPFSLLISPTILQINNRGPILKVDAENNYSSSSVTLSTIPTTLEGQAGEAGLTKNKSVFLRRTPEGLVGGEVQAPVLQNRNQYKLKELYTRRHHLMKLANINLIKIYPLKFEKLCEVLNSIFNKPVELDLIRLHYPYNDSNILVRLLAFMVNKIKFRRITRRLFNKAVVKSIKKINNKDQVNIIPAFISGITIKVAGRLMKYKVVPRKTVKIIRRGSSSIGKVNYSDISRYTNKNKRGSFTITVKSGHNFFN